MMIREAVRLADKKKRKQFAEDCVEIIRKKLVKQKAVRDISAGKNKKE